ncbi:MAG: hypothetical protein KDK91_13080 [Gammaproteobacteria bacterium]|nr:hypothetical protein [Gammaproteobacteria bacterium]
MKASFLSQALSTVVIATVLVAAATAGLIIGVLALAALSVAYVTGRMTLPAATRRRVQMSGAARKGTVIDGRCEVVKE